MSWQRVGCAFALAAVLSLSASVGVAQAQAQPSPFTGLDATPKGTIGLGLVGAELGLIIPSVAGLAKPWALTVFPVVGATGGALTGYFTLDRPGREKGAVAALVVGIAGVLPAILVTVKGVHEERQNTYGPGPPTDLTEKQRRALETAEAGPGLLRRSRSGLRVSLPAVSFGGVGADDAESARMGGLRKETKMRLSLASGVF